MSEEVLAYFCDRVQAGVERIRAQVRHAEVNPQEVTRPLVQLLTSKINRSYNEYERYYSQLIDVCFETDVATYEKKREEFDELFLEIARAIQSMKVLLLYPSVQHQPVQLLQQPQETHTESIVVPEENDELARSVATCNSPVEPTPTATTKVVIKVGEPSVLSLSTDVPSHEVLLCEHPSADTANPLPKVEQPPTASSCAPAVAAEPALSPTRSDSQTVVVAPLADVRATPSDERDSIQFSGATPEQPTQAGEVGKPRSSQGKQQIKRRLDRWAAREPTCIEAKQQQRPRERKWRFQPPRPPDYETSPSTATIRQRPEHRFTLRHGFAEVFHPSSGGRMFGLHPNVYFTRHSAVPRQRVL